MAEIPDSVINKINKFLLLIEDKQIRIQKAVLFGSYASGNYNEWSDIDLALVSDDFSGNNFKDKLELIDLIFAAGKDLSPVTFTSYDYNNSLFARDEIEKKGILIKSAY
ncbi:MAG: nucleotidyltransferase domain-containing protein [Candidatus Kapabacteria bacterium]|jgi:predicted nucleotidyltransferase|nr:nucleotidyltransferase domain-containing protein [Candidatus Kapabacteria bacterium]